MTRIVWDQTGQRTYETGVDHGVLYIPTNGIYSKGYAWNGLTSVSEAPSGAEANPQYADNIKYLNLVSAEEFGATIEAFTYPEAFGQCDGTAEPVPGLQVGQQSRKTFGLAYRTILGNDVDLNDYGYKLHLVYGALAAPSEKAYATVNDSPEAITFSWEMTTTPVDVPGLKPSATLTLNSRTVGKDKMKEIEDILYGTTGSDPRLPLPAEIISILDGSVQEVDPVEPTMSGNVITIPEVEGVSYYINDTIVTGDVTITENTVVFAQPKQGYKFPNVTDSDWLFTV